MNIISTIIDDLVEVGMKVAEAVVPGAPAIIEAGKKVVELIDKVQDIAELPQADIAKLNLTREALEAKVNEHADQVIDRLNDTPQ